MRRVVVVSLLAGAFLIAAPAADAGGGCHRSGQTSSSVGTTIEMSMMCMNPTILRTDSHDVTFVNRDSVTHNVLGMAWGRDELLPGESFTQRFSEGTHLFACTLHPGMVGSVVVGDTDANLTAAAPIAATNAPSSSNSGLGFGLLIGAALGALGSIALRRIVRRPSA